MAVRGAWRTLGLCGVLAVQAARAASLPGDISVPKDVKLPANVTLSIYVPAQARRFHTSLGGGFVHGQTLEDTVLSAAQLFFSEAHMAEAGADAQFGLLLALHPEIKANSGHPTLSLEYSAFSGGDEPLLKGTETVQIELNTLGDPVDRATLHVTEQVMAVIITGLRPDAAKFPAALSLKSRPLDFVASKEKPWATGTGFYINTAGQVMTAAHVVQDCVKLDVKRDDKVLPAHVAARSNVLDVAVLDTGVEVKSFLPFRRDLSFELGEAVTNVGYPLQSILAESPNLTRGNVSSRGGVNGALGQFQFSAPIQPGSSGGPVVSDGGEVLGVTVGTLNAAALARAGTIPQNVNFALDARYAAKFLQKNSLIFSSVDPNTHGDMHTANAAALAAVVNVQCFE